MADTRVVVILGARQVGKSTLLEQIARVEGSRREILTQVFHFRDRDQREVDIVLEHRDGSISAVEVKSAATVHRRDLRGLTHLRDKLGRAFKAGVLLYTGANTVPFGDRLAAVPISGLWADASA